ncbi:MAG: hypothetical protein JWO28_73, partial [Hyphomicrobiales bacterium]|nr:hypothetical protein [Hyphomicrobiales bacterium]
TDAQQTYQRAVDQGRISQAAAAAEIANIQAKLGQLSNTQKATGVATQNLQFQMASLAGGMGLFGQVLSMLGPWGFAAAVGFGAISAAINHMESEAARMADKANEMRSFAETTGLSITQLKALGRAGAEFGVRTDTIAAAVDKFTVSMEDARQKTGTLYDAVRQIDGGLANELAGAKTTAQAWDVLGRARAAASDQSKNALSKAAFGKGGLDVGLVLDATEQSGGLDVIINRQQKLNGLTDDQIKKWGITKTQIDETQKRTANLMASTYTQEVLDRQLQAALLEERITRAIIAGTAERQKSVSGQYDALGNYTPGATAPQTPIEAATSSLAAGLNAGQKPDLSGYDAQRKAIEAVTAAVKSGIDEDKARRDAAIGDANQTKERVAYLGSAATAEERASARIKDLTASLLQNKIGQEDYNRAVGAVNLDKSAALIGGRVSALGAAATVTDLLAQKEVQLAQARQQGAGLSTAQEANQRRLVVEQANGVGAVNAQIDATKVQAATIGMSVGAAAEYTAIQTKMNEAIRAGNPLNAEQEAALRKSAAALRDETQAAALKAAQSSANFTGQTMFMSSSDLAAAQVMHSIYNDEWQSHMDSALAKQIKMNSQLGEAKDTAQQFASSFVQGLLQGKSGMDALVGAADALASKMADKALTDLFSGNFLQAGVEGVIAVGASLFSGDSKAKKQIQEAQDTWKKAGPAFETFISQMTGGVQGELSQKIQAAQSQMTDFSIQAEKAHDNAGVNKAQQAYRDFVFSTSLSFAAMFDATAKALSDGMGQDSPFAKAVSNVQAQLQSSKAFIDDTKTAYGNIYGVDDREHSADSRFNAQVDTAEDTAKDYMLSLLQTQPELSTVATRMAQISGTAEALQGALTDLGMSAGEAAAAIQKGATKALNDLRDSFTSDLTSRLNTANGLGYLNDTTALLAKHKQDLADAAATGASMSLVAAVFQAEAQKIVNDAGLVGDAFTDFTKQFPDLASVVGEASDSIAQSVKEQQAALNSSAKSIVDYIAGITVGSSSTLSPQDRLNAAQAAYNAKLVLAQSGNADAQG